MNKEKRIYKFLKYGFRIYNLCLIAIGITFLLMPTVFATDDTISVINNLSDFIFSITRVIGMIIVGYAVVQIGLAFPSHDASQRVNGFLFLAGGVIIMFAKEIVNMIAG